ncbi:MAG: hypothetical protein AAGE18_04250 [Pseudomonadota bacterium]
MIADGSGAMALLTDIVRIGHLFFMAMGIGCVVATHAGTLRSLNAPLSAPRLAQIEHVHGLLMAALVGAWVTGVVLVYLRTGGVIAEFSPKLWIKLMVVSVLMLTALAVRRHVMPVLEAAVGRRLLDLGFGAKLRLAVFSGLSAAGWSSALILGASQAVKAMDWAPLISFFGLLYLAGLGGAVTAAAFAHLADWVVKCWNEDGGEAPGLNTGLDSPAERLP